MQRRRIGRQPHGIAGLHTGAAHGKDAELLAGQLDVELRRQAERLHHPHLALQRTVIGQPDMFRPQADGDGVAVLQRQAVRQKQRLTIGQHGIRLPTLANRAPARSSCLVSR